MKTYTAIIVWYTHNRWVSKPYNRKVKVKAESEDEAIELVNNSIEEGERIFDIK